MIRVFDHTAALAGYGDAAFLDALDALAAELGAGQPCPFDPFARATFRNAVKTFAEDPDRDAKFLRLAGFDLARAGGLALRP
jgi:hypothetical protein